MTKNSKDIYWKSNLKPTLYVIVHSSDMISLYGVIKGLSIHLHSPTRLCKVNHKRSTSLYISSDPRLASRFRIVKHPAYEYVLKLGRERKNAILLDLPCCSKLKLPHRFWLYNIILSTVGCDSRIIIADGYPSENVIAADLHGGKSFNVV